VGHKLVLFGPILGLYIGAAKVTEIG